MNNRVCSVLTTNQPPLGVATGQQGTEVIHTNEDARLHCQIDHLLWSAGRIELTPQLWVTIHPIAELFHSTQKGLEVFEHAAVAGRIQRYSGNGLGNAELDE